MKQQAFKLLSKLLDKSESRAALKAIEKMLTIGIPFNGPHGFKLKELTPDRALMSIPFKRVNKNHLGTVHACAIATLGEFPAGLLLIKNFSPANYRIVMVRLESDYHKHGVGELYGSSDLSNETRLKLGEELDRDGISNVIMKTNISNQKGQAIATIHTHWQVKRWDLVKKH